MPAGRKRKAVVSAGDDEETKRLKTEDSAGQSNVPEQNVAQEQKDTQGQNDAQEQNAAQTADTRDSDNSKKPATDPGNVSELSSDTDHCARPSDTHKGGFFGGVTLEEARLLPVGPLGQSHSGGLYYTRLERELKRLEENPPALPPSKVRDQSSKPAKTWWKREARLGETPAQRDEREAYHLEMSQRDKLYDRARNNESRQLIEAREKETIHRNEVIIRKQHSEIAWLRIKLIALGGDPAEWDDDVSEDVKKRMHQHSKVVVKQIKRDRNAHRQAVVNRDRIRRNGEEQKNKAIWLEMEENRIQQEAEEESKKTGVLHHPIAVQPSGRGTARARPASRATPQDFQLAPSVVPPTTNPYWQPPVQGPTIQPDFQQPAASFNQIPTNPYTTDLQPAYSLAHHLQQPTYNNYPSPPTPAAAAHTQFPVIQYQQNSYMNPTLFPQIQQDAMANAMANAGLIQPQFGGGPDDHYVDHGDADDEDTDV